MLEPVSQMHALIDIFLALTEENFRNFVTKQLKLQVKMLICTHDGTLRRIMEHLLAFLEHFDVAAEGRTIFCNNAMTCTPISM